MKTYKELLQLTLDVIGEAFEDPRYACDGLCLIADYLIKRDLIVNFENVKLKNYLIKHLPEQMLTPSFGYCWTPGSLIPRVIWLKEQIDKLS